MLTGFAVAPVSALHDGILLVIGFIRLHIYIADVAAIILVIILAIVLVGDVAASTRRRANLALPKRKLTVEMDAVLASTAVPLVSARHGVDLLVIWDDLVIGLVCPR
jgi:hypothetical protein